MASKMFAIDNLFCVTSYIDSSIRASDNIENKFQDLVDTFPELKQRIIKNSTNILMEDVEINIKDHFTVKKESVDNFDAFTKTIESTPFQSDVQWFLYSLEDDEKKKYRLYFKLNHVYADGYTAVEMVNHFYGTKRIKDPQMRSIPILDRLYYILIGTFIVLYDSFKTFLKIFATKSPIYTSQTDTIRISFNIDKIKEFSKKKNYTINDILYLILLRTDKLYFGEREIVSLSPIKIMGKSKNNLSFIVLKSENHIVLDEIHAKFNILKYSLYMPLLSLCMNTVAGALPLGFIKGISDHILNNVDYLYTNLVGPEGLDAHIQITPRNKEIIFNVISCSSVINITCSFKEGVIEDKIRYEKCIYAAYNEIISILPPSEETSV